jgi:hypothetical protein
MDNRLIFSPVPVETGSDLSANGEPADGSNAGNLSPVAGKSGPTGETSE